MCERDAANLADREPISLSDLLLKLGVNRLVVIKRFVIQGVFFYDFPTFGGLDVGLKFWSFAEWGKACL